MGYKLCIAEKPSVAKEIAKVVGASQTGNGYYHGNGYIVTYAFGHLVGLAEPNEYGFVGKENIYKDEYRERVWNETPLLPDNFKLVVLEDKKQQFEVVKSLMHRNDVDEIIDCGDMGAEGHILQWFIREKAQCTKPVRRFCAVSMTEQALKEAMGKLRNIDDFTPIIRGEFCKKKADWILGMSLSRVLSLKYNKFLPVGRVQTPTLAFVVKRYADVMRFKPTTYYTMKATVDNVKPFNLFWNVDIDNIFNPSIKDKDNRVLDKVSVDKKCAEIKEAGEAQILKVITAQKSTDRPQLYDLITLQRDANRLYGYTAQFTLDVAQALYETQKVLSYPRTDSKYITQDLAVLMNERVQMISTISTYNSVASKLLNTGLNIDKKICDDSKVSDHHALIVTEQIKNFDMSKMSMKLSSEENKKGVTQDAMEKILNLVITRMLLAFSTAYLYEQTDVVARTKNGITMVARGKHPLSLGWKAYEYELMKGSKEEEEPSSEDSQEFPKLTERQTVRISDCTVVMKKTTPPKLHTEDTLLSAMENAGSKLENGAILKGRGIGTQATRGEVIKSLHEAGYIEDEKKGKTIYLKPTMKGLNLIQILPQDLYSPQISADWETHIANIVSGTETENDFMTSFIRYITDKTNEIKGTAASASFDDRSSYGTCPYCGSPVYRRARKEGQKIIAYDYYCANWRKCIWRLRTDDFVVKTRTGRKLTEAEALKLIKHGIVNLKCKKKADPNSTYYADFEFDVVKKPDNKGEIKEYCNIKATLTKKGAKQ